MEQCELLVDYCDVFISCLDSHSDGTHSLLRIHWWASHLMLNFSKLFPWDELISSRMSWVTWGLVKFQQIIIFGWTILLTTSIVVQTYYSTLLTTRFHNRDKSILLVLMHENKLSEMLLDTDCIQMNLWPQVHTPLLQFQYQNILSNVWEIKSF